MESTNKSVVLLGGNHKAFSVKRGTNGTVEHFHCQRQALDLACKQFQKATRQLGLPATLYTAIDHLGGARILTGKRGNSAVLSVQDLIAIVRNPLIEVLEENGVDPSHLRILPERTLTAHSRVLHDEELLTPEAACSAFKVDGRAVCKGLAAAYMDYAARDTSKLNTVRHMDWFIESGEGTAVPTPEIYRRGTSIIRLGLLEKTNYPKWSENVAIRGFHISSQGELRQIA